MEWKHRGRDKNVEYGRKKQQDSFERYINDTTIWKWIHNKNVIAGIAFDYINRQNLSVYAQHLDTKFGAKVPVLGNYIL